MTPNSRNTFIKYCLQKLGSPVIEINVAPEQIEDRVDDALQFFRDRHFDGVERIYLKYTVTSDDMTNKYIPVSPLITGVIRVFPLNSSQNANFSNPFNIKYQFALSQMHEIASTSIIYYDQVMSHLALIDYEFSTAPVFEFSKYKNRIELAAQWGTEIVEGDVIIFECYRALDPSEFPSLWDDFFLKRYCVLLLKEQWGRNLSKYENMQLPGGVLFNGSKIYNEAVAEIEKLEEQMISMWEAPPMGFLA